jgi:hypothetical protein
MTAGGELPEAGRRARPPAPAVAAAAAVLALAVLALAALAGASGGALAGLCLVLAAVLGVTAMLLRSGACAVLAAALAVGALAGLVGMALGTRAGAGGAVGAPFPAVVGLPLAEAEAAFRQHGPVHFQIMRVPYGRRGTVLRATGYSTDGSYVPGSTITLVVGTVPPHTTTAPAAP